MDSDEAREVINGKYFLSEGEPLRQVLLHLLDRLDRLEAAQQPIRPDPSDMA